MSKRIGKRTGREAKKRRRRHERRAAGHPAMWRHQVCASIAREVAELFRPGRIAIFPPVLGGEREEPLTDSELAMRFALESMAAATDLPVSRVLGPDTAITAEQAARIMTLATSPARTQTQARQGLNAAGESDLRAYYGMDLGVVAPPPKESE